MTRFSPTTGQALSLSEWEKTQRWFNRVPGFSGATTGLCLTPGSIYEIMNGRGACWPPIRPIAHFVQGLIFTHSPAPAPVIAPPEPAEYFFKRPMVWLTTLGLMGILVFAVINRQSLFHKTEEPVYSPSNAWYYKIGGPGNKPVIEERLRNDWTLAQACKSRSIPCNGPERM